MSIVTASRTLLRLSALMMILGLTTSVSAQSFSVSGSTSDTVDVSSFVGVTSSHDFVVTNNTGVPMNVFGSFSGTGNGVFSLAGLGMVSLGANATDTLTINYSPVVSGVTNAIVTFFNGIDSIRRYVQGVATSTFTVNADLDSEGELEFETRVGTTDSATVTVINNTNSNISVAGAITGSGAASYSIAGGNTISVAANDSTDVTIRFTPTAAGDVDATLTLTSGGSTASIALSGEAEGNVSTDSLRLRVLESEIEFDDLEVGEQECQAVVLQNTTNATMTVTEATLVGVSGGNNQFSIQNQGSGTMTIAAGASDSIIVCYRAFQADEEVKALLKVTYRSGDSLSGSKTLFVELEGSAEDEPDTTNLNIVSRVKFEAEVGEIVCKTVRVPNPSAVLGGTLLFTLEDENAGFTIQSSDSVVVGPLGVGTVTVCFTGDSTRLESSTNLSVTAIATGGIFLGSFSVQLTGETEIDDEDIADSLGIGNCLSIRRDRNLLGPVVHMGTATQTVTITNRTNQAATITGATITANGGGSQQAAFSLGGATFPMTVGAFGSTTFTVTFNPNDSTRVSYNARLNLDVTGTVCDDITVNLHGVSLPSVANGGNGRVLDTLDIVGRLGGSGNAVVVVSGACEGDSQVVAFRNNLNTSLTVTNLRFVGEGAADFTLISTTPALPVVLAAGELLNITVRYNCDDTAGFHNAILQLNTAGSLQPQTFDFQTFQAAPLASVDATENHGVTIAVSPNPSRGMVKIEVADAASARIDILNIMGATVASFEGLTWTWNGQLDGTNVSSGTYLVRVSGTNVGGERFVTTRQIVIER